AACVPGRRHGGVQDENAHRRAPHRSNEGEAVDEGMRVCVVGDELVAGLGDARGLGWVGRVMARTTTENPVLVAPLAVPGESTSALSARWESETQRRFGAHSDNRLVIGLGSQDILDGVSVARS